MRILKEGDKSKAICPKCKDIMSITYRYADFNYKGHVIKNVLRGYCDECGEVVSFPHQSTLKIREFNESHSKALEVRVPSHYKDILLAIGNAHKISWEPNGIFRLVSELYTESLRSSYNQKAILQFFHALNDKLAEGKNSDRLSCRMPLSSYEYLGEIASKNNYKVSELAKAFIINAKYDLLDHTKSEKSKSFESLAARR